MSAKGIFWLSRLAPDEIKNGAFRVLFHLAQSHSDDKDPRVACYPSQATLMSRTGLSPGSLNNALNDLEEAGFIRRRRTTIKGTAKQRTFYILACDFPMLNELPESIDEEANIDEITNSSRVEFAPRKLQKSGEQTPKKGGSKLQPAGEDNINNNIKDSSSTVSTSSEKKRSFSEIFFAELLQALGVAEKGWWSGERARDHVQRWFNLGLNEDQLLIAAKKNRSNFSEAPNGPKALDAAMRLAAGAPDARAAASISDQLTFWAALIKDPARYVAPSSIKPALARQLISSGMVSATDLRVRSIAF